MTTYLRLPIQRPWALPSDYARATFSHRVLAWRLARYQMMADLSSTGLGLLWLAIAPALVAIPGVLIFGTLLQVDRGVEHYPLFATIGLVVFRQMSRSWSRTVSANRPLGLLNVPPGTPAAVGVMSFAIQETLTAAFAMSFLIIWGIAIGATSFTAVLAVLPLLLVVGAMTTAYGVLIAGVVGHFDDLAEIFPHAIRALGHASGIWYLPQLFTENRWFATFFDWNPIGIAIELARVVTLGYAWRPVLSISLIANIVVPATVGFLLLWRNESHSEKVK